MWIEIVKWRGQLRYEDLAAKTLTLNALHLRLVEINTLELFAINNRATASVDSMVNEAKSIRWIIARVNNEDEWTRPTWVHVSQDEIDILTNLNLNIHLYNEKEFEAANAN
jgi:hypothetical protein